MKARKLKSRLRMHDWQVVHQQSAYDFPKWKCLKCGAEVEAYRILFVGKKEVRAPSGKGVRLLAEEQGIHSDCRLELTKQVLEI